MATKFQKMVKEKKELLIQALKEDGWEENRYGQMVVKKEGRTLRMKFMPRVVRYEVKTSSGDWTRFRSAEYENIKISKSNGSLMLSGFHR